MAKRLIDDDPYRTALLDGLEADPGLTPPADETSLLPPSDTAGERIDDPAEGDPALLPPSDESVPGPGDTETVPTETTAALPSVLAGWDPGKWADPTHTTIKYTAGRIFAKYAPSDWLDPAKRTQIVAELTAAGLHPTVIGDDQIDFGDGYGPVDVVQGASEGGKAWQWGLVSEAPTAATGGLTAADLVSSLTPASSGYTASSYVNGLMPIDVASILEGTGGTAGMALSPDQSAYAYPATGTGTAATGTGTAATSTATPGMPSYTPTYAPSYTRNPAADTLRAQLDALLAEAPVGTDITLPTNDLSDPLHQTLLSLMTMDPTAVSIDDPALSGAAEAYRRGQERSMQQRIRDAAERHASMGLSDSGAAVSEADRYSMDYGNAIAGYNADLVTNEIAARRNQVMQALQTGAGVLSNEQSLALQEQLAELNAALSQSSQRQNAMLSALGLAQSNEQAQNQYGLNAAALANTANYNQAQVALANAARTQSAQQFAATMGYNYAALSQADKQWMANLQAQLAQFNQTMQYNYDTLGAQVGYNQALLNQNALLAALG